MIIPVRRQPQTLVKFQALAEKLFAQGYDEARIAAGLNETYAPQMPVSADEIAAWRHDLRWIRRTEPNRGQRVTPPDGYKPGPWEPMFRSWMG